MIETQVIQLFQDHTCRKWQYQDWSPSLTNFYAHILDLDYISSPNTPYTTPLLILLKLHRHYPVRYFHHVDENLHLERTGEFVKVTHQNFFPWNLFLSILCIQTLCSLQYPSQIPAHPISQSIPCTAPSSVVSHSSETYTTFCCYHSLGPST